MAVDAEPDAEPKPAEAEEHGDGKMKLGNEPRKEDWKENEVSQRELTGVERSGHDKGGNDSPEPCRGDESFVGHVALHVGEEGGPTGVDDSGRGSLRGDGVAACVRLIPSALLSDVAITRFVPPP